MANDEEDLSPEEIIKNLEQKASAPSPAPILRIPDYYRPPSSSAQDLFSTEEAIARLLSETNKPELLSRFTELNDEEINAITIAEILGRFVYDQTTTVRKGNVVSEGSTMLLDLTTTFKEHKVSRDREGRREVFSLSTIWGFRPESRGVMKFGAVK